MAKIELPIVEAQAGLGRRRWLQGILGGVGAGLAIPGLAETHPVHAHLGDQAKVAGADAKVVAAGWKPEFLDAHQFETLSSLSERILPGAVKLRADRFIDQLLAVDSQANQVGFLSALGAMDAEARARFAKPWKALTEPQQIEILTAASTTAPGGPPGRNLRDHFDELKGWIVGSYYSTEAGMRELGWTGNQFYTSFPGCEHPDGHK
jgi:Gluconate 2-dehydrogenase subunit 3